jgi:hypothetical protein
MSETTITAGQVKAAVQKCGSERKAAAALGITRHAMRRVLSSDGNAQVKQPQEPVKAATLRGFTVGTSTRVSSKRPASTIRGRLYDLKRGMAFLEVDVAREWVISAGTLRKHAQDADCFRYVEVASEKWEPCVMHPDTAKLYPVNK